MILGAIEHEQVFNVLAYIKSKVKNKLDKNLETCLRIYTSKYALDNFPYDRAIYTWDSIANKRGASRTKCAEDAENMEVEVIHKDEFYQQVVENGLFQMQEGDEDEESANAEFSFSFVNQIHC